MACLLPQSTRLQQPCNTTLLGFMKVLLPTPWAIRVVSFIKSIPSLLPSALTLHHQHRLFTLFIECQCIQTQTHRNQFRQVYSSLPLPLFTLKHNTLTILHHLPSKPNRLQFRQIYSSRLSHGATLQLKGSSSETRIAQYQVLQQGNTRNLKYCKVLKVIVSNLHSLQQGTVLHIQAV